MRGRKTVLVRPRQIVAYCRVSHAEQAENGLSLDVQQSRLRAYAEATGRSLGSVYVDAGVSAGSMRRPELRKLLDDAKAGRVEAVLVTKLDRLSRNLADLLEMVRLFDRHRVALISTSETIDTGGAAGRMMLQLLGVFAEFERGRTSERIRDVLSERRLQRKIYSRAVPFGFKRSGNDLVRDAQQQAALGEARSMQSSGASYRQIAARMTELRVTTNSGGRRWYPETVRQVLGSRISRE